MTESIQPDMPQLWEDAEGWERYYAALSDQEKRAKAFEAGAFQPDRVRHYAEEMRRLGSKDLWVAGCGCSCVGWMFALCGINVRVTDVSSTVIAFQQSEVARETAARMLGKKEASITGKELTALIAKGGEGAVRERFQALQKQSLDESMVKTLLANQEGYLSAERHDFREPFVEKAFDLILNIKAMQGFTVENQRIIARTHYRALRPKGTAFFAVQNVQDTQADDFEQALQDAGFLVPGAESNQWRRQMLRQTGIPYAMVLGRAMIPMTEKYENDTELWKRDMARLAAFDAEFKERLKAEHERACKRDAEESQSRYAQIIWATG